MNRRNARLAAITLVISLLCVSAVADTVIKVRLLVAKDLPALSAARTGKVLRQAEIIIKEICKRDVRFEATPPEDLDGFLNDQARRIAPYEVPADAVMDLMSPPLDGLRSAIEKKLDSATEREELRRLLPRKQALQINSSRSAGAALLSGAYLDGLDKLKAAKAGDRGITLTDNNWRRYSLGHWGTYLHSADWSESYVLYLSNGLLIENVMDGASPLQLLRGGITNAVTLPASRCACVSYHAICSDQLGGGNPNLLPMSGDEKDQAIAYVIAQQVGLGLLLGRGTTSDVNAGLDRLLYMARSPVELSDLRALRLKDATHVSNGMIESYTYKVVLRMRVFLAQGRRKEAEEEARRADDPRFNPDDRPFVESLLSKPEDLYH